MPARVRHPGSIVETAWLQRHLKDDNLHAAEVDVGTNAYEQGRIPGTTNVPWPTAVNEADDTFKSVEEFRKIYSGKGITPNKEIITYLRIGGNGPPTPGSPWPRSCAIARCATTTAPGPSTAVPSAPPTNDGQPRRWQGKGFRTAAGNLSLDA